MRNDFGLFDWPDPPLERENREDRAHREEEMLDADDDRQWREIEKSLDEALAAMRERRSK
jgi:hypothetical protein